MKTIQQRLQSRIAKRRNAIRFVEEDVASAKATRRRSTALCNAFGFEHDFGELNGYIREGQSVLNLLANDQKLDKRIKQIINEYDNTRQWHGLGLLA